MTDGSFSGQPTTRQPILESGHTQHGNVQPAHRRPVDPRSRARSDTPCRFGRLTFGRRDLTANAQRPRRDLTDALLWRALYGPKSSGRAVVEAGIASAVMARCRRVRAAIDVRENPADYERPQAATDWSIVRVRSRSTLRRRSRRRRVPMAGGGSRARARPRTSTRRGSAAQECRRQGCA
jgi:hypothetical protein